MPVAHGAVTLPGKPLGMTAWTQFRMVRRYGDHAFQRLTDGFLSVSVIVGSDGFHHAPPKEKAARRTHVERRRSFKPIKA